MNKHFGSLDCMPTVVLFTHIFILLLILSFFDLKFYLSSRVWFLCLLWLQQRDRLLVCPWRSSLCSSCWQWLEKLILWKNCFIFVMKAVLERGAKICSQSEQVRVGCWVCWHLLMLTLPWVSKQPGLLLAGSWASQKQPLWMRLKAATQRSVHQSVWEDAWDWPIGHSLIWQWLSAGNTNKATFFPQIFLLCFLFQEGFSILYFPHTTWVAACSPKCSLEVTLAMDLELAWSPCTFRSIFLTSLPCLQTHMKCCMWHSVLVHLVRLYFNFI